MTRENPQNPWARYADDGIAHCRSQSKAEKLLVKLDQRFKECGLYVNFEQTAFTKSLIIGCGDPGSDLV